ncbi:MULTISPECIES: 50S ribosomal protein L32 [Terrabacteria group]|uniref:50S ribosomal protein L32 n=1 Tax=Bacillati TaxID=1783272 RepID=UPI0019395217|nr:MULTISPECIES: 50S ribosomal protein L32 [Terrabacteria group]MBW9212290.1 50S ribosomal protein L32 [Trueperella sp. zg.1013]QRG86171.1 50S ribosomal protein L32 [Bulleidia sp. zg-1006]
MAVQQRRNSKTRKNKRRTHYKLAAATFVKCPNCGAYKLPHHACPSCGSTGKESSAVNA